MQVTVVAVGKLRPYYQEAAETYLVRLRRYWSVRMVDVREASKAGGEVVQRREEAKRVRKAIPRDALTVALSRGGRAWTSTELSKEIGRWGGAGRELVFVVGGPFGLAEEFLISADARWSLGPLTLPHQLARVIVMEQLYRVATLQHGHPYHKGGKRGGGAP